MDLVFLIPPGRIAEPSGVPDLYVVHIFVPAACCGVRFLAVHVRTQSEHDVVAGSQSWHVRWPGSPRSVFGKFDREFFNFEGQFSCSSACLLNIMHKVGVCVILYHTVPYVGQIHVFGHSISDLYSEWAASWQARTLNTNHYMNHFRQWQCSMWLTCYTPLHTTLLPFLWCHIFLTPIFLAVFVPMKNLFLSGRPHICDLVSCTVIHWSLTCHWSLTHTIPGSKERKKSYFFGLSHFRYL